MTHPTVRTSVLPTLALLGLACVPAAARAQEGGPAPPWPAVQVGLKVGFDGNSNGTVVGSQMRIPVLRTGAVEVVPSFDVTFLSQLREYQGSVDAVYVFGNGGSGIFGGGGAVWRNTIFDGPERETRTGWSLVAGLTSRGRGDLPLGTQVELRWVFLDAPFKPRTISLGVNLPLWGWGGRGGSG